MCHVLVLTKVMNVYCSFSFHKVLYDVHGSHMHSCVYIEEKTGNNNILYNNQHYNFDALLDSLERQWSGLTLLSQSDDSD